MHVITIGDVLCDWLQCNAIKWSKFNDDKPLYSGGFLEASPLVCRSSADIGRPLATS